MFCHSNARCKFMLISSFMLIKLTKTDEIMCALLFVKRFSAELAIKQTTRKRSAPINSRLNVVVRSPVPFGLGRNRCWPSRGSQFWGSMVFRHAPSLGRGRVTNNNNNNQKKIEDGEIFLVIFTLINIS